MFCAGRRDEVDPSPRCCTGEDCLQRSRGRHAVVTALRTDNYLPLLLVSTRPCLSIHVCPGGTLRLCGPPPYADWQNAVVICAE